MVMSGAVLGALFFLSNLARTSVAESTRGITLKPGTVIQDGSIVSVEYTLTDDGGAVIDTNVGKEPLTFIEGVGQIVKGLEQELLGLKVGDQKKVRVKPEEGYGLSDPAAFQEIPRSDTPALHHSNLLMRPKLFYGYVILARCFANMVVMRGVNGAFGVYYIALLEEFAWSRSDGATVASANFFVYAVVAALVGLAFDRFGPRLLMPLGALLVGAGLVLSSFANSLASLYFSYGIVTALGQGAL